MEHIYLLTLATTATISALLTILYFKFDKVREFFNRKIFFRFTEDLTTDKIYAILKKLQPLQRAYIRRIVREYLRELQTDEKTKKVD